MSIENKEISESNIDKINNLIVDAIQDVKGKNILKLDLRKLDSAPTDFFIICEGESSTQVRAIASKVNKRLKDDLGLRPNHIEGKDNGEWILVDYFNTVLHIFYPETRKFFELEDLWSDANITEYENI